MNNKVIENFRDHPSLRYDPYQLIFKIDEKVYLICQSVVNEIIPKQIEHINIGEPYKNLVRLWFKFVEDDKTIYLEGIDFAPDYEEDLKQLLC